MKGNTVILTHSGADLDAISSMYAVSKVYPGASLIHPGSLDINANKLVSIFGESIKLLKVRELPRSFKNEIKRVIIVDTGNYNRIGEGREFLNIGGVEIVVFDHHQPASDIPGAKVVFKQCGATTTIITALLLKKKVILTSFEATLIALGIFEDTGSFSFPSVTMEDFSAMTFLFSFGVNMKIIHRFLSPFLNDIQVKLLLNLLDNYQEYKVKGLRVAIACGEIENYIPGISLIAHKMIELIDTDAVFLLVKMQRDVFVIGRSSSEDLDVRGVISSLGGWGHPTAASVTLKDVNIEEIKEKILSAISLSYYPVLRARHIMSAPVKTISPDTGIKQALNIMIRMGYSGLPIEEDGRIIGMISKRDIEKILLFEKRDRPVKQYAAPSVVRVDADADLREVEEAMIQNDVGRVLIQDKKKIVGIISRSDLLKAYKLKEELAIQPSIAPSAFIPEKGEVERLMRKEFTKDIFLLIKRFGGIAEAIGQKIYLVGGAVRDLFLGEKSVDLDFVLSDDAIEFGNRLKKEFNANIKIYPETQTVTFIFNGITVDFTTSRREYYDEKSLVPIVEKASLKEDLKRRDFTINTMAIDVTLKEFGTLYDFYGGYTDLTKRKISVLHSLSFIEDPSRILRAVKYMIKYKFSLSDDTLSLLKRAVELGALKSKHSQRIVNELMELLSGPLAEKAIMEMEKLGILRELFKIKRLSNIKKERIKNVKNLLDKYHLEENTALIYISILLDGKLPREKAETLRFLSIKNRVISDIINGTKILKKFHTSFGVTPKEDSYLMLKDVKDFYLISYLTKVNRKEKDFIEDYLTYVRYIKIEVRGIDLKNLGIKEGPQYRQIFNELLKLRINRKIVTKEEEINYIIKNRERLVLNGSKNRKAY